MKTATRVVLSPHPPVRVSTDTGGGVRFGTFRLDLHSRELREGDRTRRMTSQPFEILRLMLERPGEVIARQELQRRLWPDGTFVDFDHSLNAAVRRLRTALGDNAGTPRFVETLPGHGYRFRGEKATAAPVWGRPRLAVLPFTDLGGGPPDETFAVGMTEELMAELGLRAASGFDLVAGGMSAGFKRTRPQLREAGTVLSADYVVEGSVRSQGERIRIVARLAHTSTETHLWAESYDRRRADPLALQRDIAACVAASVAAALRRHPSPPSTVVPPPPARDEVPHAPQAPLSNSRRVVGLGIAAIVVWALVFWTLYSTLYATASPGGGTDLPGPWYADFGNGRQSEWEAASLTPGMSPAQRAHDSVRCMPVAKSIAGV